MTALAGTASSASSVQTIESGQCSPSGSTSPRAHLNTTRLPVHQRSKQLMEQCIENQPSTFLSKMPIELRYKCFDELFPEVRTIEMDMDPCLNPQKPVDFSNLSLTYRKLKTEIEAWFEGKP